MPRSPGHPFYAALNKLLAEAKFTAYVGGLCEPLYRDGGRPSIPPGGFFRMLFIGSFEGIDSPRGIAWRCSNSLSLRTFLGLKPTESSPERSSLTVIRKRMPKLIDLVFAFVLKVAFGSGSRGSGRRCDPFSRPAASPSRSPKQPPPLGSRVQHRPRRHHIGPVPRWQPFLDPALPPPQVNQAGNSAMQGSRGR